MKSRGRLRKARVAASLFLLLAVAALRAAPTSRPARIDLSRAELMALERSPELKSLEAKAASADFALKLGIGDFFPKLSFEYIDSSNIVTGGADAASIQWSVSVVQPLYDGGRMLRRRRLAEADIELQGRSVKDKMREIREAVDTAYYRDLMLERKIGVQLDALKIADQELEIARAQRALGGIRDIDLLESELQRSSLELSLRSSEADLEEAEFALRQLVGLRSSEVLELIGDFDAEYSGLDLPADAGFLGALALEGNLELSLRQAELRKKLAALVEAGQWCLPKLSFEGGLSLSGERYPLQGASVNGKLVFEIPAPTSPASFSLSSGSSTGDRRARGSSIALEPLGELASLAERRAAVEEYALMRQVIDEMGAELEFNVKKALASYVKDKTSLEVQRKDLGLQRKKAEIQKKLLELGEATRVDYLKTLATAAAGESSILESVLALRQAEREIERLVGLESGGLARAASSFAAGGR